MDIQLPKYVRIRRESYHYSRRYPTAIAHLVTQNVFTYPLQLRVDIATEIEIVKGAIEAGEAYHRQVTLITNSDPEALTTIGKHKAATEYLRKLSLKAGDLQGYDVGAADDAMPDFAEVIDKYNKGEALTLKDTVVADAYKMLVNKVKAKPRTLGSLWDVYVADRGIDVSSRTGLKSVRRWERFIGLTGDRIVGGNTIDYINEGLDAYVQERTGAVTSATINRELSDVMACLRLANDTNRLGWHLALPRIKATPATPRHPLEPKDQIALVTAILHPHSSIQPKYGVAMLLCLQGGMMTSEIGRLRPEDIALDAAVPHLKVVNDTKTNDRKRIVPIVLGRELIADNIADTIEWLQGSTESTPSGTLKKIMRRTLNNPSTSAHCLRHTFKVNGQVAGVSVLTIASIAGWADSQRTVSSHLLSYGSEGISQSSIMQELYKDSQLIHAHLLAITFDAASNVSNINSRA